MIVYWVELLNPKPNQKYYSIKCILSKLMEDGMSFDEANDYFEFNILGLNGQESFPAFLIDYEEGV